MARKFILVRAVADALTDPVHIALVFDEALDHLCEYEGCPDSITNEMSEYYDCCKCMCGEKRLRDPRACWEEYLAMRAGVV